MINCRSLLYWGVVWEVPWCCHRLPGLPSQIWWVTFFFYCKILFFCLQQKPTSYALFLHKLLTSSQPPLPPPCSRLLIKLPLVALESHGIFNVSSALKWLVNLWLQIYLTIKALLKVLRRFSERAYLSHTSRVNFFASSVFVSIHSPHSCGQPVSLPQFVGQANIDMLNMKYFTFPCEHILKRHVVFFVFYHYRFCNHLIWWAYGGKK